VHAALGSAVDPPEKPKLKPEEVEAVIEAIAASEWARRLAEKMAITPEAQKIVARKLAESVVRRIL